MAEKKVKYTELLPQEFRERIAEKPIAYIPLGTLEWHGEHLPLGSDAIISETLMIKCAREIGGIVMPPIHLAPDRTTLMPDGSYMQGMEHPDLSGAGYQLDGSCYWVTKGFFMCLIDAMLAQLKRAGFKAVFADGHGPSRWSWAENIKEREKLFDMKLFGITPELDKTWPCQNDHAGRNETSLMMVSKPELVDLSHISQDRTVWPLAVLGDDPRGSTLEYGNECFNKAVNIVKKMFEKHKI